MPKCFICKKNINRKSVIAKGSLVALKHGKKTVYACKHHHGMMEERNHQLGIK